MKDNTSHAASSNSTRVLLECNSTRVLLACSIKVLLDYCWPGNIRELENILERASAFCEHHRINPEDLDLSPEVPHAHPTATMVPESLAGQTLKEIEKRALIDTLEAEGGNKAMAARRLGVSEKSIYNKLRRFDLFDVYKN